MRLINKDETPEKQFVIINIEDAGGAPVQTLRLGKNEYFELLAKTALDLGGKNHYESFCRATGIPAKGRIYRVLNTSPTVADVVGIVAIGYVAVKVGSWIANTELGLRIRGVERVEEHELVGVQAAPAAVPAPQSMSFVA
jgi:hypothetical protein